MSARSFKDSILSQKGVLYPSKLVGFGISIDDIFGGCYMGVNNDHIQDVLIITTNQLSVTYFVNSIKFINNYSLFKISSYIFASPIANSIGFIPFFL
ncbi:MAG: hypothetical protein IPO92_17140 [Saprospiraceae bacterium]|nr:hypothetical protein [Saprospiraceae bacterium]